MKPILVSTFFVLIVCLLNICSPQSDFDNDVDVDEVTPLQTKHLIRGGVERLHKLANNATLNALNLLTGSHTGRVRQVLEKFMLSIPGFEKETVGFLFELFDMIVENVKLIIEQVRKLGSVFAQHGFKLITN